MVIWTATKHRFHKAQYSIHTVSGKKPF
uniref:Uncharacterized protein n=1 Tax=Anguilla anguilla TaxID=7936 RepID=A0A0E9T319_ANGAN